MSAVASGILMCWGNWNLLEEDVTGNGSYGDPSDTEDARDHNYANEIEDRQWGSLGSALDFEHDAAGNTREKPLSSTAEFRYTHDAWNRLVKIEEVVSGSPTTITEQAFNGLHWRTVLKQDTTQVRNGLDQVRRQYYDASWRLVFESIDDSWSSGFTEDRVVEQFWGLRYLDNAVPRRTQANDLDSVPARRRRARRRRTLACAHHA